jgi:hypothetical protein
MHAADSVFAVLRLTDVGGVYEPMYGPWNDSCLLVFFLTGL